MCRYAAVADTAMLESVHATKTNCDGVVGLTSIPMPARLWKADSPSDVIRSEGSSVAVE